MDTRPSSPEIVKSLALHRESAIHVSTYCGTRAERIDEFFGFLKGRIATARKYGCSGLRPIPDPASRGTAHRRGFAVGCRGRALRARPVRQAPWPVRQGSAQLGAAPPLGAEDRRAGPRLVLSWCTTNVRGKFPPCNLLVTNEYRGPRIEARSDRDRLPSIKFLVGHEAQRCPCRKAWLHRRERSTNP